MNYRYMHNTANRLFLTIITAYFFFRKLIFSSTVGRFLILRGRLAPKDRFAILPRLDFLSPFPMCTLNFNWIP